MYNRTILGHPVIMKKFIHNFIHCGLLGWCLEIIFTAFHSFRKRESRFAGFTSYGRLRILGLAAF